MPVAFAGYRASMIIVVFIAAFLAFLVSAVSGGGAGLVLVPILRAVVPIATVPAALSIGTAASAASRIVVFRRDIRWDVVRRFVPAALPATALGAWLLSRFEPAYVEFIIACFLLANLPALFRRGAGAVRAPLSPRRLPLIGALAGLLSGFTGAVGLLFNGAYQRLGLTPHEIVATRATNEVLLHLLKIALYAWLGLLTGGALAAGLLVAVAAVLASFAVRWLLPLIREGLFRRIGHGAMVVAGAAMFMLSGDQIARLHRAWVEHVAPGGENELQFYWRGARALALEWEPEGHAAVERAIPFDALPATYRARALAIAPRDRIMLVEEVHSPKGHYYELYYRAADGREAKVELDGG
ncbi:MAG: sulfite exporter TauE/SafE family protein [Candidatus Sphingomonas colombiensis]|nr:sulfite exporter TauE/SafE family protein [Sphingomonas sp.]WEK44910.1 MAG: sulfite exporter TauE/SafE family protein [Sphingomonas sp.]